MKSYSEDFYTDWLHDNLSSLQSEWSKFNPDEFSEYCKEQFKLWCEDND